MRYINVLFILTFIAFANLRASATIDVAVPETIVLFADDNLGIVYTHQLQKNQTVYGLAKFFNTDMNHIKSANPDLDFRDVKLNQKINIPINTSMITSERNLSPSKSYMPVFYTVKAKDNLFRISKVYFNQKIENLMNINNLESMSLSIGQKILVGWYEYDAEYKKRLAWNAEGIEVNTVVKNNQPIDQQDRPVFSKVVTDKTDEPSITKTAKKQNEIKSQEVTAKEKVNNSNPEVAKPIENPVQDKVEEDVVEEEVTKEEVEEVNKEIEMSSDPFKNRNKIYEGDYEGKPEIISEKIRAEWNMKSKDRHNLFALHASAKKGSYIEIYNPMMDTKVIAKVVGNLPPKAHKKNVDLIISPKVAETLGAVDKRFYVKVRFIE